MAAGVVVVYQTGIGILKHAYSTTETTKPKDQAAKDLEAGQKRLMEIAGRFEGAPWKWIYSASYVASAFLLTGLFGHLSIAVGRVALREIVETRRPLGAVLIVIGNGWSVVFLSAATMLLVGALSSPALFMMIPVFFILLRASPIWAWVLFASAGTATWGMSSGPLKLVVAVGMIPWIISIIFVALTAVNLVYRERLHRLAVLFLRRCVTNGPLKVLGAIAGLLIAVVVAGHEI